MYGRRSTRIMFKKIPETKVLSIFYKGAYDEIGVAYSFLMKYVEDNGYQVSGRSRECYIDGIWNKESVDEWLTEIQIPIVQEERKLTFDFKKEFKEYYRPKNKPEIINVPSFNFIAIRGKGNPNEENGSYRQAIQVLYAVAYTLKMSYKTDYQIKGFYQFVVPPLEGFWWQENVDYLHKENFNWISVIRLPDFITKKI